MTVNRGLRQHVPINPESGRCVPPPARGGCWGLPGGRRNKEKGPHTRRGPSSGRKSPKDLQCAPENRLAPHDQNMAPFINKWLMARSFFRLRAFFSAREVIRCFP